MIEFLQALCDPDNQFLRLALFTGSLASLAFGIVGTYVVTRRIAYLAGAISHCAFGGIGASLYLQYKMNLTWLNPIYGATLSALLASLIIGFVTLYAHRREDAVISAIWVIGMAAGLLLIDSTPGYFEISSYLFGDILLIAPSDVWLVACLDVIVLTITLLFYNKLLAISFDDEFAVLRGVNVGGFYILLLCLTALTVILLVQVVGIVMVIALLTLPAAIAREFGKKFSHIIVFAILLCVVFIWIGTAASFIYDLSAGPAIIAVAGISYLITIAGIKTFGKRS